MPSLSFPLNLVGGAAPRFQLFGMGHRRKLLYRDGQLFDACTGEWLREWTLTPDIPVLYEPSEYRVTFETESGTVRIVEDEEGVFIEGEGDRRSLTRSPVRLPRFEEHSQAALLRALHAELLLNVTPFGPVPNFMVYPRPWYRDAALMLMCFAQTGNLALVEPWVMGLTQVFDYNNHGVAEADNPGQLLYMISLIGDRDHPLVDAARKELKRFERENYILGLSDYAEHPVYQTKWAKFGIRALGLDDPYRIPPIADTYSPLFWMDYRDHHAPVTRFDDRTASLYPYLRWAEAHFFNEPPPALPQADDFPLTWEAHASDAAYFRMQTAADVYKTARIATPHTWHAAEMFLYLSDASLPETLRQNR